MTAFAGRHLRAWALVASLSPALLACPSSPYPEAGVDLTTQPRGPAATRAAERPKLRVSVAAMLSPQGTLSSYSRLLEILGNRLGLEVELVQRRTYREVNDLLATGQIDAAIVCTGGWLELEKRVPGRVELLAVPMIGGETTYRSQLIVPAASPARSLSDLAGKRFAFTDDLSLSGRAYAVYLLRLRKANPPAFFGSVQVTLSHDRSIEAVAARVVDGAVVDSLILDAMIARRPALSSAVRVLQSSPPFGAPPVVASTLVPAERRAAIRDALLALDRDPAAAGALADIGIQRFVPAPHGLYDRARTVMEATW